MELTGQIKEKESLDNVIKQIIERLDELNTEQQYNILMEVMHSLKNRKESEIKELEENINIKKNQLEKFVTIKIER